MDGYIIYTDIGYQNKWGELVDDARESLIYKNKSKALEDVKDIWKRKKDYGISLVGIAEIEIKAIIKNRKGIKKCSK